MKNYIIKSIKHYQKTSEKSKKLRWKAPSEHITVLKAIPSGLNTLYYIPISSNSGDKHKKEK